MVSSFNSVLDFLKDIIDGLIENFYLSSDSKVKFLALLSFFIPVFSLFVSIVFKFVLGFIGTNRTTVYSMSKLNDIKELSARNSLVSFGKTVRNIDSRDIKNLYNFKGVKTNSFNKISFYSKIRSNLKSRR